MPKNKGAGGKKFKKIKHNLETETKQIDLPVDGQQFGLVTKLLGNGRVGITYIKDDIGYNVLGVICVLVDEPSSVNALLNSSS